MSTRVWSAAGRAVNFGVGWCPGAVALREEVSGKVAFGTEQTSSDTGGTTNDFYIGPESAAITVSGSPAAGDHVMFRVHRNPSAGSDTMAIDARLHGVLIFYTTNAQDDA